MKSDLSLEFSLLVRRKRLQNKEMILKRYLSRNTGRI